MSCASPRRGPWESPIRPRRSWGAMVPSGPVPAPPPPPLSVEPTFTHVSHGRKLGMDDTPHSTARHDEDNGRRDFLKGAVVAGGAAASLGLGAVAAQAQPGRVPGTLNHYYVPATDKTVHWGYFSKLLKPLVEVSSGDFVTIDVLTHHANDDAERMVKGDPGAEAVFYWDRQRKGVDRRGAGPMQPTLFGRGAGEGLGVHICTGPVAVKGAMPGDILEVRIIDLKPRPCANPRYKGKSFGSNAAAWWGFHYKDLITDPKPREVITIYEVDPSGERNWAQGVYNFRWTPQTDPFGVVHKKDTLAGTALAGLDYPLLETQDEWVLHGFSYPRYLTELGAEAQSKIYEKSSVDLAMKDAFRKMRHFLMTTKGLSEDEAISLMSIAVDFGITQVVDGNWGVHAVIKKSIFAGG